MYLGRADMLCPPIVSRFVPGTDIASLERYWRLKHELLARYQSKRPCINLPLRPWPSKTGPDAIHRSLRFLVGRPSTVH